MKDGERQTGVLFSIITPSYNRGLMIEDAIRSVLEQGIDEFEHVVVDGCSNDSTTEVLAKYPHLTIIRERDRGMYDALNKGIAVARGEIVGLLNTDDVIATGALAKVAARFEDPSVVAVHGGSEIYENGGGGPHVVRSFRRAQDIALSWPNVTVGVGTINARFWRRSFLNEVGKFDLRYQIAADRDFLIRATRLKPKSALIEEIVYRYQLHPGSLTFNHAEPRWRTEHLQMAQRYLAEAELSDEGRYWVRKLHTKDTIESFVTGLLRRDMRKAVDAGVTGWKWDFRWPLRLLRVVVSEIRRKLSR